HPSTGAALALGESGACQRYQSPTQPPGPPEGWAAVALVSPASFCIRGCGRVCSGFWALFLCFWGRNESGSGLLTVSDTVMTHPDWLIFIHKSFMHKGLDCVPRPFSRGFFIIWRLK